MSLIWAVGPKTTSVCEKIDIRTFARLVDTTYGHGEQVSLRELRFWLPHRKIFLKTISKLVMYVIFKQPGRICGAGLAGAVYGD